jgi:hypothetical protein
MSDVLFALVKWYILVEIVSLFSTGMSWWPRLITYYRIRKWIKKNLPNNSHTIQGKKITWKWKVGFVTLSKKKFFLEGRMLMDKKLMLTKRPIYAFVEHRYGKEINNLEKILEKIKVIDYNFDPTIHKRNCRIGEIID